MITPRGQESLSGQGDQPLKDLFSTDDRGYKLECKNISLLLFSSKTTSPLRLGVGKREGMEIERNVSSGWQLKII